MYERPELNEIGNAEDIILGIDSLGYDFDGMMIYKDFEFADDEE